MDDDLESELMDLGTNESVYLPQAVHSRPPPAFTAPSAARASPPAPAPAPTPQRRRSSLPASLASPYSGVAHAPRPLHADAIAALPSAPPSSSPSLLPSVDAPETTLDAGEEPAGWYDQLEMVLASAEARYFAWLGELETQGSATDEVLRQAEAQRVERRRAAVAELKQMRRAVVHAALIESSTGNPHSGDDAVDAVDAMMDKLARVVDESAMQLTKLRRSGVWHTLAENLPQVERDYVARGADEMFMEKLKYKRDPQETQEIIEHHLKVLFQRQPLTRNGQSVGRVVNHSLGQVLREFADIFHFCYGDPAVQAALAFRGKSYVSTKAATLILPRVAADINAFAAVLTQILLYKYYLPRAWGTSIVQRCVVDALFEHLQPTLHALYVAAFDTENAFLSQLCQQMCASQLESFGVSPVFRLDGTWSPDSNSTAVLRDTNDLYLQSLRQYEPVIHHMNALPSHRSPWVKAELIVGVCREIDARVKAFYAAQAALGQRCPPPAAMNMNADDLSALLAFLTASSPALCSHLVTQLALLGSFMESEVAMGEAGFAVATLWTAVSHLGHLTSQRTRNT